MKEGHSDFRARNVVVIWLIFSSEFNEQISQVQRYLRGIARLLHRKGLNSVLSKVVESDGKKMFAECEGIWKIF